MDEFDRFLAEEHRENADPQKIVTPTHVTIIIGAAHEMFVTAMGRLNQLTITLTRVQPEGTLVWSATVRGATVTSDSFEDFITMLGRIGGEQ